jgi:hypothetical protein
MRKAGSKKGSAAHAAGLGQKGRSVAVKPAKGAHFGRATAPARATSQTHEHRKAALGAFFKRFRRTGA